MGVELIHKQPAPEGRNKIARGIAPGTRAITREKALKGRNVGLFRPFRATTGNQ